MFSNIISGLVSSAFFMLESPEFWVSCFVIFMYLLVVGLFVWFCKGVINMIWYAISSDNSQDLRKAATTDSYLPSRDTTIDEKCMFDKSRCNTVCRFFKSAGHCNISSFYR